MAKLAKVFKLSFAELFILLEAWIVFFKWDLLISFTRYENWRNKMSALPDPLELNCSTAETKATVPEQVKLIIKLSEIAGRAHIRKMNCLRRCLSQQQMLLKRGLATRMHIGVNIEDEKLKAHAWLTFHGEVINDSNDVTNRYSELKAANQHSILNTLK